MVSVEDAIVVKVRKNGKNFEILVDPDKALEVKEGKKTNLDELLAYPSVYHNVRAGELASEADLKKNFGTTDVFSVAKKIIEEGELHYTTEQRRRFLDQKKNEIASIISKRSINPQTNTPHPPSRILNAIEKVGVRVDPFTDAELQVDRIVKSIKRLIPIRFESVVLQIIIPPQHAGKAYSVLKNAFEFEEKWLNDGSFQATLKIPAGMQGEVLQKIGNITRGNFTSRIIEKLMFDE